MTANEQTVANVRTFLALHYETRLQLVERAELNFERSRKGLSELKRDPLEDERRETSQAN